MTTTRSNTETSRESGFSLVELMIAMVIGSILATALVIVFSNVMQTNREQFKAAQQIENGRYAIDVMTNDLRLAGYYGEFATLPPPPSALPDPCAFPAEGSINDSTTDSPFGLYVQGYAAANLTASPSLPASCAAILDNNTLRPGSDVVVIRRLDTKPLLNPPTTATSVAPNPADVYAQTINGTMDIQYGSSSAIDGSRNATGANNAATMTRKDFTQAPAGTPPIRPTTAAYIRKVHVHVYFISNCRDGNSTDGKCPASNDGIPTLKRLELTAESGSRLMKIVPLVDGIEFLKVRYGLDTSSHIANQTFDGSVDSLVPASSVTLANWQNVVMLELRLLARNNEATSNYTDGKTYDLGVATFTPSGNDAKYKRHIYTSQVYIMNIGGRRES